ncbi:MAG: hypothetical protein BPH43C_03 [Phage 5P_1]|nr:MAG: hypothetical protein BPH43C_03 [Phage 5P_1]
MGGNMVWNGNEVEKKIWQGALKPDGTYDVSYLKACYLKGPEGDPQLKGSWSYPYRSSPDEEPNCAGLLAAEQRAKGTGNDPEVARKARNLRVRYCGAAREDSTSICLNSGEFIETSDEIIVKCSVMSAGVYNGHLKTAEELQKFTKWWEGVPIVIENENSIGDHPDTGITTANTVRVGQLRNPTWDESRQSIVAEAHFYKNDTPDWLINDLRNRKVLGVSGAYFCDFIEESGEVAGVKYRSIEINYVPNNLAIVNPACKPPRCGINVDTITDSVNEEIRSPSVKITINGIPYEEFLKSIKGGSKMSDEIKVEEKKAEPTVQLNVDELLKSKDQEIATLQAQVLQLNAQLKEYQEKERQAIIEAKKAKFLAQFPEQNREIAEKELLPIFLERPEELILNASRIAELMIVPKVTGQEYVKVEKNSELEPPSIDELRKII